MAKKKKTFTVEDLWRIERLGAPSLAPDGAQAVAALTRFSMDDNKSASSLWLLSTLGGAPRWSPRGDLIAFTAKREQQGKKDDETQLYVIAPDGGEARRAAEVATGVEAFRWCPDGRRLLFISWVRPELKGSAAQAKAHKAFKERKESGYATSEAQYRFWDHNLPQGRVAHLHLRELRADGQPGSLKKALDRICREAEVGGDPRLELDRVVHQRVELGDENAERGRVPGGQARSSRLRRGHGELVRMSRGGHAASAARAR